jgi:hypothetical protein
MAAKQGQELFFDFLQQCEQTNRKFNKVQIIAATGWKPATFKTYFGKGQITQFVSDIGANQFEAINTLDITYVEFKKRLSQSKHYQELGHKCKSNLAKALLKKSRDNYSGYVDGVKESLVRILVAILSVNSKALT